MRYLHSALSHNISMAVLESIVHKKQHDLHLSGTSLLDISSREVPDKCKSCCFLCTMLSSTAIEMLWDRAECKYLIVLSSLCYVGWRYVLLSYIAIHGEIFSELLLSSYSIIRQVIIAGESI